MEELWQDINLATLSSEIRPPHLASCQRHPYRSMIMQDFLSGVLQSRQNISASADLPLQPTAVSLTRGPGGQPNFPLLTAVSAPISSFPTEQHLLDGTPSTAAGSERRHKRMMKNRESASRSRARKQAYTNELELAVERLAEENTKLKRRNEELRLAMVDQISKKNVLQRTASWPF